MTHRTNQNASIQVCVKTRKSWYAKHKRKIDQNYDEVDCNLVGQTGQYLFFFMLKSTHMSNTYFSSLARKGKYTKFIYSCINLVQVNYINY